MILSSKSFPDWRKQFCFLIMMLFPFYNLFSQKILPDTFYVDFKTDTIVELRNICISSVIDERDDDSRFVRYESKNKYLLIPVDQEVYVKKPLAEYFKSEEKCDSIDREFRIEIRKFDIEKQKGRLKSSTYLIADMPVYEKVQDSLIYRGTYYYDYYYIPQARKENITESTQNILAEWHTEFKLDLLNLRADSLSLSLQEYSNFITDKSVRSLYLNCPVAVFAGYNWWGIQGEIFFSRPETNARNQYTSGIFRYQNTKSYESFAIGKQSKHNTYRKNTTWMYDLDFNFLIGFCKWKDVDAYKPALYQLFDFEVSSVQSIVFNPMNKRGMTFRLGIMENMNYVINKKLEFQAGLLVGLGFKL